MHIPASLAGTWFVVRNTKLDDRLMNGWQVYRIAHHGDKWQVTAPYDKPADSQGVKEALEQLEKLHFGDVTTRARDRLLPDVWRVADAGGAARARADPSSPVRALRRRMGNRVAALSILRRA